jgi:RNA polymerase sigma-70 factor, ECF subfamily
LILERLPGNPGGRGTARAANPGRSNRNSGKAEVIANDDELMRHAAGGDEEAFRRLVERWQQPVLVFLERMTGNREEARDLGQETFYRVFTQATRYQPTGQFRAWLFHIAGNLARSWLRRQRVLRWIQFDPRHHDRPSPQADGHERIERAELQERVRSALARLPDRQRQAVLLQRYEGMNYKEIAAVMGGTIPAVESLLQRAMASLRADIGTTSGLTRSTAGKREEGGAPSPDAAL